MKFSAYKILPKMFESFYYSKKLFSGDTIISFVFKKRVTEVTYQNFPSTLLLREHPPMIQFLASVFTINSLIFIVMFILKFLKSNFTISKFLFFLFFCFFSLLVFCRRQIFFLVAVTSVSYHFMSNKACSFYVIFSNSEDVFRFG